MDEDDNDGDVAVEEQVEAEEESPHAPPAEEGRRLLITKMVMENFKSYGGVREIGPFHKCFSSIVGPNGSGKSNVIDAMLFVFGKRAKKLRLNKVSELIHRSDTFPDLEFARVSVHFVDILDDGSTEDDYTEVPGTNLVVTRTAYMNNSSKYHVDGKTKTFAEVGALLRRRGIDLDNNRFLILQGEVEQIALMKPKAETPNDEGLLEYLEDIIGSNRYVEDTEKVAAEVEALNELRTEKLKRLQVAEKEKENLESAKVEAESYLEKEALLRIKRNALYQVMISEAENNSSTVMERFAELTAKQEKEQLKLADAQERLSSIEGRYDGMTAEYNAITDDLSKRKAEFAEYERKDIKFQEDTKFFNGQVRKLETALKRDEKRGAEAAARAEQASSLLPSLRKAVQNANVRLEAEESALEAVQDSLKGETGELRAELEAKQLEAAPARAEAAALRAAVETLRCEISLLEEPAANAARELEKSSAGIEDLAREAAANKEALAKAKNEAGALNGRSEALRVELAEAQQMEAVAAAAMTAALSAAEEAKANRDAAASAPKVLRGLLQASKPGGALSRAGVCGRLGDLGTIDDEYDVAVSTACSQLDYIVVETALGGQACVEYLREKGLGRASFIILEQLDHLSKAMSRPVEASSTCPRLYDLVRPAEDRYRPAFYLGLRDTLVAPDLDAATSVAYQGNRCVARVVTADGQLIDRSGTMSGGGNTVKRGGMSTGKKGSRAPASAAVSDSDIVKLEAAAAEAQADVRAIRDRIRELQDQLKGLFRREKELITEIPKLQLALDSVGARESQIKSHIEVLCGRCSISAEDQAQVDSLRKKLPKEEKDLSKIEAKLGKIEEVVSRLQASIMEVGGDRLKAATKAVERATRACDEAVSAVSAAEVEASSEAKKAERAQKNATERQQELEEATENMEAAKKGALELEEAALAVMTAYNQSKQVADEKKEELESVTKEYEELKALASRIRKVEVDITNQLEEYKSVSKENVDKAAHWRSELEKVRRVHKGEMEEWAGGEDDEDEAVGGAEAGAAKEGDSAPSPAPASSLDGEGEEGEQETSPAAAAAAAVPNRESAAEGQKSRALTQPLEDLSPEKLARCDKEELKYEIGVLEGERDALKNDVNMGVLLEYKKKEGEYLNRVKDLDGATELRNTARKRHEELRRKRLEEFMTGFGKITLRLKEMYQMITLGGDAELELVDSLDPFSEGIVFSVRPPKKSWKNIANLSGGEKTLSSLALVFALHHYKPTPLYVMDEIDAALDFKNVSIVANYIKERTKNAQFIIISLRNNMFELADRLVGIYKTHNVTKSVTINPKQFACGTGMAPSASPPPPAALGDRTNVIAG
jgi:structural maintenance of chromosome 4